MKSVFNTEKMTKWDTERAKNAEKKRGVKKRGGKVQMKNPRK